MGKLRNLDYTVRRELDKGVRTPESLRGWRIIKSADLKEDDRALKDCGLVTFPNESEIFNNHRHKDSSNRNIFNLEFVERYKN